MSNHAGLSDRTLLTNEIAAVIASTGANGTGVDMQGWDGVLFTISIGLMANGATFDARTTQSANANFSGETNIANAALTQVANTANANINLIDVYRPTSRYVRCIATPATANVTYSVTAQRYRRAGTLPPTQAASQQVRVQVN